MQSGRVCIVGGGASGLVCAHILALDYNFEPTIFEQNAFIGGQWHYDPDATVGTSAVYRDIRVYTKWSVMQFTDFPDPNSGTKSHISCTEMEEYLIAYVKQYHLHKYILLNTKVQSIDESFTVTYATRLDSSQQEQQLPVRPHQILLKKSDDYAIYSEKFDAICVANGHNSEVFIPEDIPGLHSCERTFPILHSKTYRRPEDFKDQCVIVVGGSHSGIDIAGELAPVAKQVVLSMKEDNKMFDLVISLLRRGQKQLCTDFLTTTFSFAPAIERIDRDTVYFKDKTQIKPDCLILATGYKYSIPFLQGNLRVDGREKHRYVYPLYKHMFHVNYPNGTLAFINIPSGVAAFPFAEVQSHFIARVLRGEVQLPSRDVMMSEVDNPLLPQNPKYHFLNMIDYVRTLLEMMKESDKNYNYIFTIDDERRVHKIIKE
ncbi:unnamed protein product [Rotaria sordida]|uniref:Flavin-containing monooxygenase n=1 Tax=Rotaria sordida TaxID=392033 RepID=A0A814IXU0_9BILA|nr:unnamed protein product [Rotaria sordida]CAF1030450.1 unnamed protein product [Rotaria sordida]CAF1160372.1 unnamed protein product [Rotaria sordida]CAF3948931.1 unnamed protein product [Rotaria sordida]